MEAMDKKIAENLKNRLDSHDKLWYPVVTARLVKSNQSSSDSSEEMPATLFAEIRFLHSILLSIEKRKRLMVCSAFPARSAGALVRRPVQKRNKMRDTQT